MARVEDFPIGSTVIMTDPDVGEARYMKKGKVVGHDYPYVLVRIEGEHRHGGWYPSRMSKPHIPIEI